MQMPHYAYAILAAGWLIWMTPFFLFRRERPKAQRRDRRARWGMLLQAIGYSILWQNPFWARPLPLWRTGLAVFFFAIASAFCWSGVRALGRQWRVDAGLNADHELIRSGAYRIVRHPIYASMLYLLLGTGFLITPLPILAIAVALLVAGTEIRVRVEEQLLASRFGDVHRDYRRATPAYLPFWGRAHEQAAV